MYLNVPHTSHDLDIFTLESLILDNCYWYRQISTLFFIVIYYIILYYIILYLTLID